jgi:excinuclease UvrABC ATPase subunit
MPQIPKTADIRATSLQESFRMTHRKFSPTTLLLIEHNLDLIKTADHVIDLGPEGGHAGGEVVLTGTPEQVAACKASHTGRFLKTHLRA